MTDKDDELEDMDLGDDDDMDFDDLDMDFDEGDGGEEVDLTDRTPVAGFANDTLGSFVDDFTDDKLGTVLEMGRASIPKEVSGETDVVIDGYNTIADEVRTQGHRLRREGAQTIRQLKRFIPEQAGIVHNILDKVSGLISSEDEESGGGSSAPTQSEIIAGRITELMGEKQEASAAEAQFKEQLEFARHKDIRELQANQALNLERIRKYTFEVTDRYYRSSLDISLRQLYNMEELVSITKTGFDIFKTSLEMITKNTALPEVTKIHNSELVSQRLKEQFVDNLTSSLFDKSSPTEKIVKGITGKIKEYAETGVGVLQEASGNLAMLNDLDEEGMSTGQLAGSALAGLAKDKVGSAIGKFIGSTRVGQENIRGFRNAMDDVRTTLKKTGGSDSMFSTAANIAAGFAGSGKTAFQIGRNNPDDPAYFDNRTRDSINKVIPELLSKIYGQVKTSADLQAIPYSKEALKSHGIGSSEDNELIYDRKEGGLIKRSSIVERVNDRTRKAVKDNVVKVADNAVREILKDSKLDVSPEERKVLRQALIKTVLETGMTSEKAVIESHQFRNNVREIDPDLVVKLRTAVRRYGNRVLEDDDIGRGVSNMLKSIAGAALPHEAIARDLVNRGMLPEAIKAGLVFKTKDGSIRGHRNQQIEDIINQAKDIDISVQKKEDKALTFKEYREEHPDLGMVSARTSYATYLAKFTADRLAEGVDSPDASKEETEIDGAQTRSQREAAEANETATEESAETVSDIGNMSIEEDIAAKGSYSKGGYTKDGGEHDTAGIVHSGELVINQKDLSGLVRAANAGDTSEILYKMAGQLDIVSDQSKKYTVNTDKLLAKIPEVTDSTKSIKDSVSKSAKAAKDFVKTTYEQNIKSEKHDSGVEAKAELYNSKVEKAKSSLVELLDKSANKIGGDLYGSPEATNAESTIYGSVRDSAKRVAGNVLSSSANLVRKLFTEEDSKTLNALAGATVTADELVTKTRDLFNLPSFKSVANVIESGALSMMSSLQKVLPENLVTELQLLGDRVNDLLTGEGRLNRMGIVGKNLVSDHTPQAVKDAASKTITTTKDVGAKVISKASEATESALARSRMYVDDDITVSDEAKFRVKSYINSKSSPAYVKLKNAIRAKLSGEKAIGHPLMLKAADSYSVAIQSYLDNHKGANKKYTLDQLIDIVHSGHAYRAFQHAKQDIADVKPEDLVNAAKSVGKSVSDTIHDDTTKVGKTYAKGKKIASKYAPEALQGTKLSKASVAIASRLAIKDDQSDYKLFIDNIESLLKGNSPKGPKYIKTASRDYANAITLYKEKHPDDKSNVTELVNMVGPKLVDHASTLTERVGRGIHDLYNRTLEKSGLRTNERARTHDASGYKYEFVSKWDELTPEQQDAARYAYFASEEYKSGQASSFKEWLRVYASIDPGSLDTAKGFISNIYTTYKNRLFNPIRKARDEMKDELIGRLTGTALKELSVEEEELAKEHFFKSAEYKNGDVTDFTEWLKAQGRRPANSSIFSRLKRKLTVENVFKQARRLDRYIAKKALKGMWGGTKLAGKGLGMSIKGGWKVARGMSNFALKATGLKGLGNRLLGGTRMVGGPYDPQVNYDEPHGRTVDDVYSTPSDHKRESLSDRINLARMKMGIYASRHGGMLNGMRHMFKDRYRADTGPELDTRTTTEEFRDQIEAEQKEAKSKKEVDNYNKEQKRKHDKAARDKARDRDDRDRGTPPEEQSHSAKANKKTKKASPPKQKRGKFGDRRTPSGNAPEQDMGDSSQSDDLTTATFKGARKIDRYIASKVFSRKGGSMFGAGKILKRTANMGYRASKGILKFGADATGLSSLGRRMLGGTKIVDPEGHTESLRSEPTHVDTPKTEDTAGETSVSMLTKLLGYFKHKDEKAERKETLLEKAKAKAKKKLAFLNMFRSKEPEAGDKKSLVAKVGKHFKKSATVLGTLFGIYEILKLTGVTSEDIKSGVHKVVESVKNLKPVLSSMLSMLGSVWGAARTTVGYVKTLPDRLSLTMRSVLSHIPMLGITAPTSGELASLDNPDGVTTTAPKVDEKGNVVLDKNGNPVMVEQSVSTGGMASNSSTAEALAGTAAAAWAGLKVRKGYRKYKKRKAEKAYTKEMENKTREMRDKQEEPDKNKKRGFSGKNKAHSRAAAIKARAANNKPKYVMPTPKKKGFLSRLGGKLGNIFLSKGKLKLWNKLKAFYPIMKKRIVNRAGKAGAKKLLAMLAAKLIPGPGTAMLLAQLGYYLATGHSFLSSASRALVGIDLTDEEEPSNVIDAKDKFIPKPDTAKVPAESGVVIPAANRFAHPEASTQEALRKLNEKTAKVSTTEGETSPGDPKRSSAVITAGTIPLDPTPRVDGSVDSISKSKNVDINGLLPPVLKNLLGMAEEYKSRTGKELLVSSAKRSTEEQRRLKAKFGKMAASPGRSTHEYGFGIDISSAQANDLDAFGLMRKYGFTRPIGGEAWHIEPAMAQLDVERAKRDPNFAMWAAEHSVNHGGGGFGTIPNARHAGRNKQVQLAGINAKSLIMDKPTSNDDVVIDKDTYNLKTEDGRKSTKNKVMSLADVGYTTSATPKTISDSNGNAERKPVASSPSGNPSVDHRSKPAAPIVKVEPVIKVNSDVDIDKSKHIVNISEMSSKSVDLQTQMLNVLGDISTKLEDRTLPEKPKPSGGMIESMPPSRVNLKRGAY